MISFKAGNLKDKKKERERKETSLFFNNSQCTAVVSIEASSLRL